MRYIICRFCGHHNPTGGDACENCGAEFNEGMPESPDAFEGELFGAQLGALAGTPPLWLAAATDARTAVDRMRSDGVDCVLIGEPQRLDGIFTDRDAILKLAGRSLSALTLGALMTPRPVVARPEDTVALGVHKMAIGGFRHLPLAGSAGVVAVVAAADIFRHLAARLASPGRAPLTADAATSTLGPGPAARRTER